MSNLDRKKLQKFLKLAGDRLKGRWVLMGGTVLPAMDVDYRTTTDIDIVSMDSAGQSATLKLMELAEELGLPVESINQAGAYFLMKIPDYDKHLIQLYQGKSATVFRPDLTLYLQLKIARLTETDLSDCMEYLKLTVRRNEKFNAKELLRLLSREVKKAESSPRRLRLEKLSELVRTWLV